MLHFSTELVSEALVGEAAVFFTEALAKLNARQFKRELEAGEALPCCAKCAGCRLDSSAALQDARRLLETLQGHPASVVAYSMGRELAQGVACRVVLLDAEPERLGYEREDGSLADPLAKFLPVSEGACACGNQHES
jgi:hypothetical protein